MTDLLRLIPRERPLEFFGGRTFSQVWADERRETLERQRERRQVIPPAARTISSMWFCIPETVVDESTLVDVEWRRRHYLPVGRRFGAYCGMPPGYRCRCGNGSQDHDPGDED